MPRLRNGRELPHIWKEAKDRIERMKQYRISEIPRESWIALYGVFWRETPDCLSKDCAADGIIPKNVERTKHGICISGEMQFLPRMENYPTILLLARPRFSSILDFNPKKLASAAIRASSLEHGILNIKIG
jgi:hypothetical protein